MAASKKKNKDGFIGGKILTNKEQIEYASNIAKANKKELLEEKEATETNETD